MTGFRNFFPRQEAREQKHAQRLAQRNNKKFNPEKSARNRERLNINPRHKSSVSTQVLPRDNSEALETMMKNGRQILDQMSETDDLHHKYTFKDLLVAISALGGYRLGGRTNGSHFSFTIDGAGTLHVVYAHGDHDCRYSSGSYVKAFIAQLRWLGVIGGPSS